ncbi:peptidoglycan-binding domain-containing protein [Pleomorphovibrio marinus]|uniref:peptidoglycan-binding domain-containing protein n=1 Tax=Pleomorphovibrio marinus TaxID=2164132 RepID=UPI000E0C6227|nr:peptidoglycan-binding domain-containing protein [Pleomorphovibrio marinus]
METKTIVKLSQTLLNAKELYTGVIDGIPGPMTDQALQHFQEIPTSWPIIRRIIGFIQYASNENGIDAGPVDGIWGPQTQSAYESLSYLVEKGKPLPIWRPDEIKSLHPNRWPIQHSQAFHDLYGERGEHNLTAIRVPYPMMVSWEPYSTVRTIRCHNKVAESLEKILVKVRDTYGENDIKKLRLNLFGGCFNNRRMRQGQNWSMHAWGVALDFDPENNPLSAGRDRATFAKADYEEWWKCWEEEGWTSLGKRLNFDWMHVQAARVF